MSTTRHESNDGPPPDPARYDVVGYTDGEGASQPVELWKGLELPDDLCSRVAAEALDRYERVEVRRLPAPGREDFEDPTVVAIFTKAGVRVLGESFVSVASVMSPMSRHLANPRARVNNGVVVEFDGADEWWRDVAKAVPEAEPDPDRWLLVARANGAVMPGKYYHDPYVKTPWLVLDLDAVGPLGPLQQVDDVTHWRPWPRSPQPPAGGPGGKGPEVRAS